jgi:hypothetical protein
MGTLEDVAIGTYATPAVELDLDHSGIGGMTDILPEKVVPKSIAIASCSFDMFKVISLTALGGRDSSKGDKEGEKEKSQEVEEFDWNT